MLFASRIARVVRCCSAVVAINSLLIPVLPAQAPPVSLQITILEGEDAMNNIRQRTARERIVQVEDENHKPVAGAAVVFLLPNQGASGVFANGSRTLTVMTDNQGRAVAHGFHPNGVQGKLQMRVSASYQGKTANTTITQTNAVAATAGAAAGAGISAKLIAIIAIAGAAVAGGVVAATRHSGSSTPAATPTTITP